jgi:hypothetical protein
MLKLRSVFLSAATAALLAAAPAFGAGMGWANRNVGGGRSGREYDRGGRSLPEWQGCRAKAYRVLRGDR